MHAHILADSYAFCLYLNLVTAAPVSLVRLILLSFTDSLVYWPLYVWPAIISTFSLLWFLKAESVYGLNKILSILFCLSLIAAPHAYLYDYTLLLLPLTLLYLDENRLSNDLNLSKMLSYIIYISCSILAIAGEGYIYMGLAAPFAILVLNINSKVRSYKLSNLSC